MTERFRSAHLEAHTDSDDEYTASESVCIIVSNIWQNHYISLLVFWQDGLLHGQEESVFTRVRGEAVKDPCFFLMIVLAGYLQGSMGLSMLTLAYLYKDDLGYEPTTVAILTSISALPWLLKPVWGICSDAVPIWGYRRLSYLVLAMVAFCSGWFLCAVCVWTGPLVVFAAFLSNFGLAIISTVTKAIVVERYHASKQDSTFLSF